MFTLEVKLEKLIPLAQDCLDKQEVQRRDFDKITTDTRDLTQRFEAYTVQTDAAVYNHEKALEDKEKRLRVIEVPYETDAQRFEKLEAQIAAIKYPVMDIYSKIDDLQQGMTENQKKSRELSDELSTLSKTVEQI